MIDNKGNKKEKAQEKSFHKVHVNWDIRIFRKVDSNHWKYWIFNIEIFTFLKENVNMYYLKK